MSFDAQATSAIRAERASSLHSAKMNQFRIKRLLKSINRNIWHWLVSKSVVNARHSSRSFEANEQANRRRREKQSHALTSGSISTIVCLQSACSYCCCGCCCGCCCCTEQKAISPFFGMPSTPNKKNRYSLPYIHACEAVLKLNSVEHII